jgi:outer membrane autotransporter protein
MDTKNKKSFLKNFLATTSAIAVIAGASSAMGDRTTNTAGGDATFANGNGSINITNFSGVGGAPDFSNGDTFHFSKANASTTASAVTIASIDMNNIAAGTFTVAHDASLGSTVDVAGNGVNKLNVIVNDGKALKLTGSAGIDAVNNAIAANSYGALGNITLGSGTGLSKLTIDSSTTLGGTINSDATKTGVIEINIGKAVVFDGALGKNNSIAEMRLLGLNSEVTLNESSTVGQIILTTGTATLNLKDGKEITGVVRGSAADSGVFNLEGGGKISGVVGGGIVNLLEVNLNGAGDVDFDDCVFAKTLKIADAGANAKFNNGDFKGNISFAADGTVTVADGVKVVGKIDSPTTLRFGTVIFSGDGEVTDEIGETKILKLIKVTGGKGKVVTLHDSQFDTLELTNGAVVRVSDQTEVDKLVISHTDSNVEVADGEIFSFSGIQSQDIKGGVKNIVFVGNDSQLYLSDENGKKPIYTISDEALDTGNASRGIISLFAGGTDGMGLGIDSLVTVQGEALGGVNSFAKISIEGDKKVRLENKGFNADLLRIDAGSTLEYAPTVDVSFNLATFGDDASTMKLEAVTADRTFTQNKNIDPGANDRGTIILHSVAGKKLTLTAAGGVKTLGVAGGAGGIHELDVTGSGTSEVTDQVDLTNILTLNVKNGATLDAKHKGVAAIAAINIGEAAGAGTLIIDANADYDLNTGSNISYKHASSWVKLTNSTAGDKTVKLDQTLAPGGVPTDLFGSLEINSNGTNKLNMDFANAATIGTSAILRLNELKISGDKETKIDPDIFAKTINVTSTGDVEFAGVVDSGGNSVINFNAAGNTKFSENVSATTIAYGNNARIVTVEDGKTLTTEAITSNVGGGSELILAGDTTLATADAANPIALDRIKTGANGNNAIINSGQYTVTDIQLLHAGGATKFADGFVLNGGFNVAGGAAGKLEFLGDARINGNIGSAGNAAGAITVAGNNKTLQIKGSVTATSLDGVANAGDTQDLKFINTVADVTVTGTVGATKVFKQIEFNGGKKVTFAGAGDLRAPTTLLFSATGEVETDGFDLGATAITKTANNSTLHVNINQAITGNIAAFGLLNVKGDKTVTLNTANFLAGITAENNNEVTVDFIHAAAATAVKSVGTNAKKVKLLKFTETGTVTGDAYATKIEIEGGKVATFGDVVKVGAGDLNLGDATSIATFNKVGLDVDFNIRGGGIVNFNEVTINNALGADGARLARANFTADTTLSADLHSNVISFVDKKIDLTKAVKLDGAATFAGSEINLGSHDMTMVGGNVTFTGAAKINTKVTDKTFDLGNLVAGQGSTITLVGLGNTLVINLDDAGIVPVNDTTLKLITKEGTGTFAIDLAKVTVTATSAFSEWKKSIVSNELILTNVTKIEKVLEDDANKAGLSDVIPEDVRNIFANFVPGTEGHEFIKSIDKMDSPNRADASARLANTTSNEVQQSTFESIKEISEIVSNHIAETTGFQTNAASFGPSNKTVSGASSGDEYDRYGIWGTPFYSKSTQKKRGSSSGYKSTSYGGTVGLDTKANEDLMIGLAFSAMNSEIRHKDFKSGDKTKINSYLLSAYANHQFSNNFFGQGVFSIGSSTADNKENRRVSNTQISTAVGKYNSMIFSSEVLGGYNHAVSDQLVVSPMIGLNYSRINSAGYKESGNAGTPLLEVNKKASHKLDIVGGVKVDAAPFMVNDVAISPNAHAFVRHDLIGKGAKVSAKLSGLSTISENAKLQKTFYSVGAGLNAAYGSMDYGVSADANFANKYVGLQGSLKLRVNF